jgi:hypothetical protein
MPSGTGQKHGASGSFPTHGHGKACGWNVAGNDKVHMACEDFKIIHTISKWE